MVHLLPLLVGYTFFGLCCLLVWALLYHRPAAAPGAGITWLVFIVLGMLRVPLIDFAYWLTGVEPLGMVVSRMSLSVVITAQLFALVGVVGELVHRSKQSEAELWRAQQSIAAPSEAKHQAASFWKHDVLETIERKLDELFSTWNNTPPSNPQVVARGLLDFVSEVVRPLSHAMHSFPTTHSVGRADRPTTGDPPAARNRVKWARLRVASAATVVAFCAPVLAVYALVRYGIGLEVVAALMMLPVLGVGFWLTRRLVDSMAQATPATTTLISLVCLIVVCTGATALPIALGQYLGLAVVFLWAQPIQALAVGLGLSIAEYLVFHAQQREQLRLDTLERLARDSAATEAVWAFPPSQLGRRGLDSAKKTAL